MSDSYITFVSQYNEMQWMLKKIKILTVSRFSVRKSLYHVEDRDLRSLKIDRDLAQNRIEWKIAIRKPV